MKKSNDELVLDEDLKAQLSSPFWGNNDNERAQGEYNRDADDIANVRHEQPTVKEVFPMRD